MKVFLSLPACLFLSLAAASLAPCHAATKKAKAARANTKPSSQAAKNADSGKTVEIYLTAQMNLLSILDRYASTLAGAVDRSSAENAAASIANITKEVIVAGEDIVKLGRPSPDIEAKLMMNQDLIAASRMVAEHTKAAVTGIAANPEVRPVVGPAVQQFQAALNRLQQTAEDPQAPSAAATAPAGAAGGNPVDPVVSGSNPFAGAPAPTPEPVPPPAPPAPAGGGN